MHNAVDVAKHGNGDEKDPNLVREYARTNMGWSSVSTDGMPFYLQLDFTLAFILQSRYRSMEIPHPSGTHPITDPREGGPTKVRR
jgi:hypothetical protein